MAITVYIETQTGMDSMNDDRMGRGFLFVPCGFYKVKT